MLPMTTEELESCLSSCWSMTLDGSQMCTSRFASFVCRRSLACWRCTFGQRQMFFRESFLNCSWFEFVIRVNIRKSTAVKKCCSWSCNCTSDVGLRGYWSRGGARTEGCTPACRVFIQPTVRRRRACPPNANSRRRWSDHCQAALTTGSQAWQSCMWFL